MFVCSASASEFEVIFSSLGLMLSMIATRADDLPVINDSEAFQYVGKAVERARHLGQRSDRNRTNPIG